MIMKIHQNIEIKRLEQTIRWIVRYSDAWRPNKLCRPPTAMELVERTKKLKSGVWVNDKARNFEEQFHQKRDEVMSHASQEDGTYGEEPPLRPPSMIIPYICRSSDDRIRRARV